MGVTFRFSNTYKEINRIFMGIEIAYKLLAKHCHRAEGYSHLLRVRVYLYIYIHSTAKPSSCMAYRLMIIVFTAGCCEILAAV